MSVGTIDVTLRAHAKQFNNVISQSQGELSSFGSKAGKIAKGVGVAAAAGGALAAVGIKKSVSTFLGFDDAMTQSLAIMTGVNDGTRVQLEKTARQVAKTTRFSSEQAAQSYFYLASAGLDAQQSMAAMPQVAAFASAGNFEMALATDLLTDAQSALGLSSKDAGENLSNMTKVSDTLVKANTLANASVEQFSKALTSKAGTSAKTLGQDVEEVTAVLAAFADQGIKGSAAGTAYNILTRELVSKGRQNREEFEALGIAVYDAEGNLRNMGDILLDFEKATAGLSDIEVSNIFSQLGFQDKSSVFIKAVIDQGDEIKNFEAQLRESSGATDDIVEKNLASYSGQLDLLKSRFDDIFLSIGQWATPILLDVLLALEKAFYYMKDRVFPATVEAARNIKNAIVDFYNGVKDGYLAVQGAVIDFLKRMGSIISGVFTAIKEAAADFIEGFKIGWGTVISGPLDKTTEIFGGLEKTTESIGEKWGWVWDGFVDAWQAVAGFAKDVGVSMLEWWDATDWLMWGVKSGTNARHAWDWVTDKLLASWNAIRQVAMWFIMSPVGLEVERQWRWVGDKLAPSWERVVQLQRQLFLDKDQDRKRELGYTELDNIVRELGYDSVDDMTKKERELYERGKIEYERSAEHARPAMLEHIRTSLGLAHSQRTTREKHGFWGGLARETVGVYSDAADYLFAGGAAAADYAELGANLTEEQKVALLKYASENWDSLTIEDKHAATWIANELYTTGSANHIRATAKNVKELGQGLGGAPQKFLEGAGYSKEEAFGMFADKAKKRVRVIGKGVEAGTGILNFATGAAGWTWDNIVEPVVPISGAIGAGAVQILALPGYMIADGAGLGFDLIRAGTGDGWHRVEEGWAEYLENTGEYDDLVMNPVVNFLDHLSPFGKHQSIWQNYMETWNVDPYWWDDNYQEVGPGLQHLARAREQHAGTDYAAQIDKMFYESHGLDLDTVLREQAAYEQEQRILKRANPSANESGSNIYIEKMEIHGVDNIDEALAELEFGIKTGGLQKNPEPTNPPPPVVEGPAAPPKPLPAPRLFG